MPRTRVVTAGAVALAVLLAALAADLWLGRVRGGPDPRPAAAPTAGRAGAREPAAIRVLVRWDRRRATAWRLGSPRRLADLYVAGSSAGTRDVAALRAYLDRGFRVRGLRMQLLQVAVLGHGPDRWRLAVTDRLVGATAVRDGRPTPLPRDGATRHVVTLMRSGDGHWRVATVAPP